MNPNFCKHWNGTINENCKAEINWRILFKNNSACSGRNSYMCYAYQKYTDIEFLELKENEQKRISELKDLAENNLSNCCKKPIDDSKLIKTGRHKGHGPKICSKCKKVLCLI